jgi:hypothetical protein
MFLMPGLVITLYTTGVMDKVGCPGGVGEAWVWGLGWRGKTAGAAASAAPAAAPAHATPALQLPPPPPHPQPLPPRRPCRPLTRRR